MNAATRDRIAELELLEEYDRARSVAGHDYGSGQRNAELGRRRREVGVDALGSEIAAAPLTADELAAAFDRVGRPRLTRSARQADRYETATARRTFATWRRIERRYGSTPTAASPTTADEHRAAAAADRQAAADSFDRSDTDGFLTQWAHGVTAREHDLAAAILEKGGLWTFPGLFDTATGARVEARMVDGNYGRVWAVRRSDGTVAHWVPAYKSGPRSKAAKLGLEERDELAPARAITWAPRGARGLAGASSVQVIAERTDGGCPADSTPYDLLRKGGTK